MADAPLWKTPSWFSDSTQPEQQEIIIQQDFDKLYGNNTIYQQASPEIQERIRLSHRADIEAQAYESEYNPRHQKARINQIQTDNSSWFANALTDVKESHKEGLAIIPLVNDLLPDGTFDPDAAEQFANVIQRRQQRGVSREKAELNFDTDKMLQVLDNDDTPVWKKALAIAKYIGIDLPSNIPGIIQIGAESSSTLTSGLIGGKLGSVVPVVGTALGAGTTMGAHSGILKLIEKVENLLNENELPPTTANIALVLKKNPDAIKEIQKASSIYGGTMGVMDTLLAGVTGKVATLPARSAQAQARRSLGAEAVGRIESAAVERAALTGRPLAQVTKELTDDVINTTARINLNNRSFKAKLGHKLTAYGAEIASEPITEATATASIGEDIDAKDLIYETLGGIGAGPYGVAVNTALFGTKVAGNKTAKFTEGLLNASPESRALKKEDRAKLQALSNMSNVEVKEPKYKKEIESIEVPTDERITEWANPESEKFNPIKAVDALSKFTDTDSVNKAKEVFNNYVGTFKNIQTELREVKAQIEKTKEDPKLTSNEKKVELFKLTQHENSLSGQLEVSVNILDNVQAKISNMNKRIKAEDSKKETTPIDTKTSPQQDIVNNVVDSFGSHLQDKQLTEIQIKEIENRPDIDKPTKDLVKSINEVNIQRNVLNKLPKTMSEVRGDIYDGLRTSEFKGIRAYKKGISDFLRSGNVAKAKSELEGLVRFRDSHAAKAKAVNEAYEQYQKNPSKAITLQFKDETLTIFKTSGNLINHINEEAKALELEVRASESLLSVQTTSSPSATIPSEKSPVKQAKNEPVVEKKSKPGNKKKKVTKKIRAEAIAFAERAVKSNASKEDIQTVKKKVTEKYGEEVAQIFQNAVNSLSKKQKNKPTEKSKDDVSTVSESRTETRQEVSGVQSEESRVVPIKDQQEKTIDSAATTDPNNVLVTFKDIHDNTVTKPYAEAVKEIKKQLEEYENIINCIGAI